MTYKPVKAVLDSLVSLESRAGRERNECLRLKGVVEVDATSLRLVRVYAGSKTFETPIKKWLAAHPRTPRPAYWLLHFRLVGAVQRSDNRKLVVRLLEHKVAPAGGKPPEGTQEIINSGLLRSVSKGSTLMADGAKSWSAAARQAGHRGDTHHVCHSKAQYTASSPNGGKTLGTQLLDRSWGCLKTCIPPNLSSRKHSSGEPAVLECVFQTLWRKSVGAAKLLAELGGLARQA